MYTIRDKHTMRSLSSGTRWRCHLLKPGYTGRVYTTLNGVLEAYVSVRSEYAYRITSEYERLRKEAHGVELVVYDEMAQHIVDLDKVCGRLRIINASTGGDMMHAERTRADRDDKRVERFSDQPYYVRQHISRAALRVLGRDKLKDVCILNTLTGERCKLSNTRL